MSTLVLVICIWCCCTLSLPLFGLSIYGVVAPLYEISIFGVVASLSIFTLIFSPIRCCCTLSLLLALYGVVAPYVYSCFGYLYMVLLHLIPILIRIDPIYGVVSPYLVYGAVAPLSIFTLIFSPMRCCCTLSLSLFGLWCCYILSLPLFKLTIYGVDCTLSLLLALYGVVAPYLYPYLGYLYILCCCTLI